MKPLDRTRSGSRAEERTTRLRRSLVDSVPVLVSMALYSQALRGKFVHLDHYQIEGNELITRAHSWLQIFARGNWSFLGGGGSYYYRPLHYFSYWMIYRLAGAQPVAFHLFQVLMYSGTVWIVHRLALELLKDRWAASVGALLWALHPAHVEAVAWISALPDVGCSFFYLLAFLLFLRAEKAENNGARLHGRVALVYLPALFFKEMALSFPILLLAYWFFDAKRESWLARALRWLPYLAAAGFYLAVRIGVLGRLTATSYFGGISLPLFTSAAKLLGEHTRIVFWPIHLNAFRNFDLHESVVSPWPVLALAGILGAFLVRKRRPVFSFLIFWWPVTLLPCLDVRQLTFPFVADRLSYLPSVGLSLAIAFCLIGWLPQDTPAPRLARLVLVSLAVVVLCWAVQTSRSISHWHDDETLVDYSLRESSNFAALHALKGAILAGQHSDLDGAKQEYEMALSLNAHSDHPLSSVAYESYIALGTIAMQKGHTDEAAGNFESAIGLSLRYTIAYKHLASVYIGLGNYQKAAKALAQAAEINPRDLDVRFNLGVCWMRLRKYRDAAEQFRAVTQIDPAYPEAERAEEEALRAERGAAGAQRE